MKSTLFIILILVFFSTACRKNKEDRYIISQAETLLKTNLDSTYLLLNNIIIPDDLDDKLFAYWCMLSGKVAESLHKDMPSIPSLLRAQSWYKQYGTVNERAQIGLYLGRSYMKEKKYEEAMSIYLEVLDIAKNNKVYDLAGYICSYIADLYELKNMLNESRVKYQESSEYFMKANNSKSYALALRDVSYIFCLQDSFDLALQTLEIADSIVVTINDSAAISSIANALGNVYTLMDSFYLAEKYLLSSLEFDTIETAPTYLALSTIFMYNSDLDKARYYLRKSDQKSKNDYTPVGITYQYYLLEKMSNNPIKALSYLESYCHLSDSISIVQNTNRITEIEKKYNHVKIVNENNRLRIDRLYLIISLIMVLIFCFSLAFIYYVKSRQDKEKIYKQQNVLDTKEKKLLQLVANLKKKDDELHELEKLLIENNCQDDIQELLKIQDIEYQKLKNEVIQTRNEVTTLRNKILFLSPIVKKAIKLSQIVVPGASKSSFTMEDWRKLTGVVNNIYFLLNEKLETKGFKENTVEIHYCYLSFLQLEKNQEAVILHINPDSVSKLRFRVRQRLQISGEKTSIYEYLIDL